MDKELFTKIEINPQSKDINNDDKRLKRKQLIIYASAGVILLFIIIVLATRNNTRKEILLENKAQKDITEENNPNELIEENGYYYCLSNDHEYNSVLRFYKESNKVIGASIGSTSSEIKFIGLFPKGNWFNENYEDSGNYEISISGNKIAFSLGKVHYKGTLLNRQKMELFVHSDINGYENTEIYKFISLDVLKDIRDLDLNDN